jgi:RNA polymerase sigma-70 factor (ECF subfamily)
MTDQAHDASELCQLRSRGAEALAELLQGYRDKLLRMIAVRLDGRVIGKVDGEDVLQDAFVEMSRRIQEYLHQPSVPLFVWLRQITKQAVIDTHRRYLGAKMRDVNQEVALDPGASSSTSSSGLVAQLADSLTTPSQCAVRAEAVATLRAALEQLDEMDREVLVLRHLEELSNNEVAQILGIDKYAASKRYLRALERLRGAMPDGDNLRH